MLTFSRLSLLLLIAGMLLGDIVLASVGLTGVCCAAFHAERREDPPAAPSTASDFIA
ncbi:hypothetical protein P0Y43_02265 [Pseudomonas entomophila]|uniref:hypothetical protein n=1 Tax=Pseudomonas entomophila TaxID=312306 RepID=UPI0023D82E46|nr:hypothetical protein [Pseudomonas entomophila]MDF0729550.1 hypothetical protein [Pseudomonas entomophila]